MLLGFGVIAVIIGIILLVFWLWTLIHCLASNLTGMQKLLWIITMVVMPLVGNILYIIFITRGKPNMKKNNRLTRDENEAIIAGVASGMGKYFDVDPVLIRLIWVLLLFISFGSALIVYIICWIVIPEESELNDVKTSKRKTKTK